MIGTFLCRQYQWCMTPSQVCIILQACMFQCVMHHGARVVTFVAGCRASTSGQQRRQPSPQVRRQRRRPGRLLCPRTTTTMRLVRAGGLSTCWMGSRCFSVRASNLPPFSMPLCTPVLASARRCHDMCGHAEGMQPASLRLCSCFRAPVLFSAYFLICEL